MAFLKSDFRSRTEELLTLADVRPDGDRPWDIQVHDTRLYARLWAEGSLGFGEAYMEGWWNCPALDALFSRILATGIPARVRTWRNGMAHLQARLVNQQSRSRAFEIGRRHYDISNELYRRMLDRRMIYSCAYWDTANDLDAAQEAKLEMIAGKLQLAPGMRVLDVGCGWGGAARYFAEHFDVSVVGLTVSSEQARWASEACHGLPVKIRLEDYRAHQGLYDRIYSIGMYEHVGYRNYRTFAEQMRRCL
ncbi:MAG: class I SAM-dependent methyltransferase, partial [Verrucomicrobiota bacterium]